MIHYFILLIIVLVCVLLYTRYRNTKEHFTDSLHGDYVAQQYKEKGIEACHSLASPNYMAENYIDTLRLRKWKPNEDDPKYKEFMQSKKTSDFCYFFMDDDKRILSTTDFPNGYAPTVDPLANFSDCSKDNPVFKNAQLITDVSQSTAHDKNHNLPYKKCILKIDRSKAANPDIVDDFWQGFSGNGNAFCEGMAKTLQNEIAAYKRKIEELKRKIKPYRDLYTSVAKLESDIKTCRQTNESLNISITDIKARLRQLQLKIDEANARYATALRDLREQLDTFKQQSNVKTSDLEQLKNNHTFVLKSDLEKLAASIKDMTLKRDKCLTELNTLVNKLNALKVEYDNAKKEYNKTTLDLAACQKELRDTNAAIEENKPLLIEAQKKLEVVSDQLKKCQADQARLLQEETWWRNKLETTTNDYNKCARSRAQLEARVNFLKQQKESLIKEIEEIKRRCRDDQSQFNMATVNMHRDASKEIISTEQQRCSASIAMRKRRIELLNELNGILLQANSCDRIVAACKCYKKIAQFGWNDEGTSATRAKTTSGRIVEIRKYLQAAPYIQFTYSNGDTSPMLMITRTRKKKGGGSYIDVAGIAAVNGAKTASMYAQG